MNNNLVIDSSYVGVPWRQVRREVTWRDTTNYAAAVDDFNPKYFDDEKYKLIAHPMFAAALTWPIASDIKSYVDLPYSDEAMNRNVHYTEFVEIEMLIPAGATVVIDSQICAVVPKRSGTEIVFRYDVRDEEGRLYHTEYNGCMLRGVECTDAGKGEETVPRSPKAPEGSKTQEVTKTPENREALADSGASGRNDAAAWQTGKAAGRNDVVREYVKRKKIKIKGTLPYIYDGCTGIVFAIHTSPAYAHKVGLPGNLLQGTCTIAMGLSFVTESACGGDPERIAAYGCRLTGMVFAGDEIELRIISATDKEVSFEVMNLTSGRAALSDGYVRLRQVAVSAAEASGHISRGEYVSCKKEPPDRRRGT